MTQPKAAETQLKSVEEMVAYWQPILGLRDWKITCKILRANQISGSMGQIEQNWQERCAELRILDLIDHNEDEYIPTDDETTVVHELMHLHLWHVTTHQELGKGIPNDLTEQAINALANGFVKLKRQIK